MYVYVGVGCCYRAFVRAKGCGDTDEVRHGAACDEFDLQRSGNNSRAAQGPLVVAAHDGATNRRSALFAETVFGISDMLLAICIYERLKNERVRALHVVVAKAVHAGAFLWVVGVQSAL